MVFESISQPSPRQNESESQVLEDWSSAFLLYFCKWFVGTLKFDDQHYGLSVCPAQFHVVATALSVTVLGRGCCFPGGSEVKASACNAGDLGSIPGPGRSPGEGNGNPLQYSCLENPMDGGAWWATVHRVAESDTTE